MLNVQLRFRHSIRWRAPPSPLINAGYVEVGGFAWLTRAGAAMSAGCAKAGDNARCGESRK
jgi:hypothetical protein